MNGSTTIRACLLIVAMSATLPADAQMTALASVRNAVGGVVVVRNGGMQERLQGKGSVLLYEGDTMKTMRARWGKTHSGRSV